MSRRRLLLLPLTALLVGAGPADTARRLFTMTDPRITESSSLVVSRRHPGVVWTANDSGDAARIFAVGSDGRTRASFLLDVGEPRDIEAMAPAKDAQGRPALLVGDIGDNNAARTNGILLHLVTEPPLDSKDERPLKATSYRLRYPDGPRDAEALTVDPRTGAVHIVTKGLLGGSVYVAPRPLVAGKVNVLRRVASAPAIITDGAALPDGRLVVRDYGGALVLSRSWDVTERFALPEQEQGESLALSADAEHVLVGSEGRDSPVWQVDLPVVARPTASPTPAASSPAAVPDATSGGRDWLPTLVAGALALVLVALLATRHRRS